MSDKLFTTHKYVIEFDHFGQDIFLPVFSDVHRFSYNCDVDGWQRFLRYCKILESKSKVHSFNGKPNFLGCPIIKITPTRTRVGGKETMTLRKSVLIGDY